MSNLKINPIYEQVEHFNPISNHRWSENGKLIGYEVSGGFWKSATFRTMEGAIKDKAIKDSIDKKISI